MRQISVTITADSESAALTRAAERLGASTGDILLRKEEEGAYHAELVNYDADIEIAVSEDGMEATVADFLPSGGEGKNLSVNSLIAALKRAGVGVTPDQEVAKSILVDAAKGKVIVGRTVVRGQEGKPAQDATLEPLGDWRFPVLPGDAFGRIIQALDAKPTLLVTGRKRPFEGKQKGKYISFPEDSYCAIDKTQLTVRSETYGMVVFKDNEVSVEPLLEISRDDMKVIATIHHKDFRGRPITAERMQQGLAIMDIVEGVNGNALATAVAEAAERERPVMNVVICQGVQPVDGLDGWFDMSVKDERSSVGQETGGRIDFRSRGVIRSVKKGEFLGKLIPPENGVPGRDIYGRIIPANDGYHFKLQIGENVENKPGTNEYYTTEDGMVFFVGATLAVTDVYQTKGDVNMGTGNLALEKGSVHVRGSVLSGFSVEAPCNLLVDEVVESAILEAGGDIEIKGGIAMDRGGQVKAAGGVSALYAKNATLKAGGDVVINHEINNCVIFAGRKVLATNGRGKIIGSTIRAGEGVAANIVGSELGVETIIFLGLERQTCGDDLKKRKEIKAVLNKIYGVVGSGDPKEILMNSPQEKRKAVAELIKARMRGEEQLKEIEQRLELEREEMRKAAKAKIIIRDTIYPGVVINCFGASMKISKIMTYTQIFYDPSRKTLVAASL